MNKLDINDKPKLLNSIIDLIDQTRHIVAKTVSQELTSLYWNIVKSINDDILKNDRADYGKKLIPTLSLAQQIITEQVSTKEIYKVLLNYTLL
jgi:hypothetical protein